MVSGFSVRIVSSAAKPSVTPSGSGGRPRSSVTTAGSAERDEVERGVAVGGDQHLIIVIGPAQLALQPLVVLDDQQLGFDVSVHARIRS